MRKFLSIVIATILVIVFMPDLVIPVRAAGNVVITWTGTEDDLYCCHTHTKGEGIPIIIMPVHFGASDLAAGGRLQTASTWAAEVIVEEADRFFNDFADYLDIYVYLGSDTVSPVPTNGYVEKWGEKWSKAVELASDRLGKDSSMLRIVYLGNSDNDGQTAGQVGGHAYGRQGAMLSWGNDANGNPWQDAPAYWARHEFFGHGFAGFADEYEMAVETGDTNLVVSETKPTNGVVPWYDFIGFTETVDGVAHEIGIYTHANEDYHGWFPVEQGFMHSADPYVSQYHKWVVYRTAMEYAGTPKTLAEFCTMQGITLNPPEPQTAMDKLFIDARNGGTCTLNGDVTVDNLELQIQNDLTLDLNGHTVTVELNIPERSAVVISEGKTLTVNDSAGGGKLVVACGSGAGISTTGATLVVNGGTLDITGGDWSSAIGGRRTDAGNVIINGGTVIATGHMQSAGIGGGSGAAGGYITINGGTVISTGGTNKLCDIGNGVGGNSCTVKITGGSVNGSIAPAPTNGTSPVYLTKITLDGIGNTQVTALTSPASYRATNLVTDVSGTLYFWLPAGETNLALTANGIAFTGTVTVAANNNNAVTLTPPAGTKVPVTISSQPSNITVTEGNSAKFVVGASGYPVPTYQWQVSTDNGSNWTNVSGATSAILTLTNVTVDGNNGSKYRCVITNTTEQVHTVTSSVATLTVTKASSSGGNLPNTDAGDMRNVFVFIFVISAAALGAILIFKSKQNL